MGKEVATILRIATSILIKIPILIMIKTRPHFSRKESVTPTGGSSLFCSPEFPPNTARLMFL